MSGTGNWHAFKLYREHPAIARHLNAFALGSGDEESTHALVVDREENQATVLLWAEARPFLRSRHPNMREAAGVIPQDDVSKAVKELLNPQHSPTSEDVIRRMQEEQRAEIALRAWLDQHLPPRE